MDEIELTGIKLSESTRRHREAVQVANRNCQFLRGCADFSQPCSTRAQIRGCPSAVVLGLKLIWRPRAVCGLAIFVIIPVFSGLCVAELSLFLCQLSDPRRFAFFRRFGVPTDPTREEGPRTPSEVGVGRGAPWRCSPHNSASGQDPYGE